MITAETRFRMNWSRRSFVREEIRAAINRITGRLD
jgi:hypothetical protein